MNNFKWFAALALSVAVCLPASASPYADAANACMANSTTGKDRKELAKWIFVAMSAHPEIRSMANVSTEQKDQSYKAVGTLFTKLIAENCAAEFQALVANENSESLKLAFESLGKLAMQEIMTDRDVNKSIASFEQYVDRAKVMAILAPKTTPVHK